MGPLSAQRRRQRIANVTELAMEMAEDVGEHVGRDDCAVDPGVYA